MERKYSGGIHSGGSSIYHNASGRKKGSGRVGENHSLCNDRRSPEGRKHHGRQHPELCTDGGDRPKDRTGHGNKEYG